MNKVYYVYLHLDPISDEIMYVGHGYKDRAWICGSTTRSSDHQKWYMRLIEAGYLPTDIVEIVDSKLSKTEACFKEQEYIRELKTPFNKPQGLSLLKVDDEMLCQARMLRAEGLSYKDIAELLGVSTMTIYRAINGQTKNLS